METVSQRGRGRTTHCFSAAHPGGRSLRISHNQGEFPLYRSAVISMLEIPKNNIYSPLEG